MGLYDDSAEDGYGTLNGVHGHEYMTRAADAAAETLLWADAYNTETGDAEDISAGFAPVSVTDLPANAAGDVRETVEWMLAQDGVAEAIDRRKITPEQFGHDLQLSRNGQGAGFWSRPEWGREGELLHSLAKTRDPLVVDFQRDEDGDITFL